MQVVGRKIVRRVVQLAGLPCWWKGQYQPPAELLARADEYVGILASILEQGKTGGTIELLQGEPLALLLKSIGNALSRSEGDGPAAGAGAAAGDAAAAAASGRQDQQQGGGCTRVSGGSGEEQLSGVAAEKLQSLRALVVLMHLLGEHLGMHALQVGGVMLGSVAWHGVYFGAEGLLDPCKWRPHKFVCTSSSSLRLSLFPPQGLWPTHRHVTALTSPAALHT